METFIWALEAIAALAGVFLMFSMFYQIVIGLFGFKKSTKDYADHDPSSRFLVLIPAHNEERVIRDIIHNLESMDYPRQLYDLYVIAVAGTPDEETEDITTILEMTNSGG